MLLTGRKWSTSTEQQERGKAKGALHNSKRKGFVSLLDRWNRDFQCRESQLSIGWTEERERVKASNVLGSNDHTYHTGKEERDLCNQIYILNTDGRTR